MTIALNIGYTGKLGSGILTYHPTIWEVDNIQHLIQVVRSKATIDSMFKWSEVRCVMPSAMALFITVGDHSFTIRMINVREYRKRWEKRYKTKWKY